MDQAQLVPLRADDGRLALELKGNVVSYWAEVGQGFSVDKPLVPTATARLSSADGDLIVLTPHLAEGMVVAFSTSEVLRPGMSYSLEVEGEDFLGVVTPPGGPVLTIADFGVLSDGTFSTGFGFDHQHMTFNAFVIGEPRDFVGSDYLEVPSETIEVALGETTVRTREGSSVVEIPLGGPPSGDVLLEFSGYAYGKFGCDATGVLLADVRLQ